MSFSNTHKERSAHGFLRVLSVVCFCAAILLMLLTLVFTSSVVENSLGSVNDWFVSVEHFIAGYAWAKALVVIVILFLFKSVVPILPFSVMFISAGMVFPASVAVLISTLGVMLFCSVKFLWGRSHGGGVLQRIVCRSRRATEFMGFHDKGNRWMLGVICFFPVLPVGAVSRAYGATCMTYATFIRLILIGVLPRIILWSFVGVNIFKPFTPGFMAPVIILLVISGVSLLILDALLKSERIEKYEKESDNES